MKCELRDTFLQRVVADGGGEYCGVQIGSRHLGIPDLILFNDPVTCTTLALIINEERITAQTVRERIARSRATYCRRARSH